MLTGQISSQARHDVHAHSSSLLMRSNIQLAGTCTSASPVPSGGEVGGLPVRAMTSPVLRMISRGSRGLPVAWAGHTDVQRPHMVQASVSSSCFHEKSSTTAAPNVSSSVSPFTRSGMGRMAPLGRSRWCRYMFSGDVNMWRSIVVGRITRKAMKAITWAAHHAWCQPATAPEPSTRVASG